MQVLLQYAICLGSIACLSRMVSVLGAHPDAHWFWLHAVGNAVVCALCAPSLLALVRDPPAAVYLPVHKTPLLGWDAAWIAMLHLYHMVAYKNVAMPDLLHHLLFVPYAQLSVMAPHLWGWTYGWGPTLQLQHLFICGLPGLLDYTCLALRKEGWLSKVHQKRLQVKFNVWLRVPGVLGSCMLLLYGTLLWSTAPLCAWVAVALNTILIGGNSLYYAERVIRASPPYT